MRIAFITYEFPPDIAQGGIATYVAQVATMLHSRGHDIEIFCGSLSRTITENIDGILIHRSKTDNPAAFRHDCISIFSERHKFKPFNIIESPEIHANGLLLKEKFPNLPLVVKLHMPLFLQMRLLNFYTPTFSKLRFFLGGLRRGRIRRYGKYDFKSDIDFKIASLADGIVSPSISLKNIISKEWKLKAEAIEVIPYPFKPSEKLLQIPIRNQGKKIVSFIGKLNIHKGLVNLVKTIPIVVKKHPDVLFNLIGNDSFFAQKKVNMSVYISRKLVGYENNYTIKGGLIYDDVMMELTQTSVCVFPSIWENFPLVCLEAMSAGRAVVGSKEGGMNEMLSDGAGIIVDPLNVNQLAAAIIALLDDDINRIALGQKARQKVLAEYNSDKIGKQLEDHFLKIVHA